MMGCKVTLVTESIPFFVSDFKFIDDGGRISCRADIDETVWLSKCEKNDFDLVLSIPMLAGVHGFNYAKKWKIPVYMMIFETPNYVSKSRGGLDSGEGRGGRRVRKYAPSRRNTRAWAAAAQVRSASRTVGSGSAKLTSQGRRNSGPSSTTLQPLPATSCWTAP
jgi:hypothetical protein